MARPKNFKILICSGSKIPLESFLLLLYCNFMKSCSFREIRKNTKLGVCLVKYAETLKFANVGNGSKM